MSRRRRPSCHVLIARGRPLRAVAAAAALAAALLGGAPAAYAAPFDCATPSAFVSLSDTDGVTQLQRLTTEPDGSATFAPIGAPSPAYNAIGFNPADGFIYGVSQAGEFVRIDAAGTVTSVGVASPAPSQFVNAGTFDDDGHYYVMAATSQTLYRVNPTTFASTPITLSASPGAADLTYADGFLWGFATAIGGAPPLVRIDPATGAVSRFDTDILPSGVAGAIWTYGSGDLGVSMNGGGVYRIHIADPGGAPPALSLVAATQGPTSGNNDGTSCQGAAADLSITKTGPASVAAGDTFDWTLSVANLGPGASSGYVVDDALPAGALVVSASGGCVIAGSNVRCAGPPMGPSLSRTITITARAPLNATTLLNAATVAGNEQDPNPADNTATAATTVVVQPPPNTAPAWVTPTPADGTQFTVTAGTPLALSLAAADADALDMVEIETVGTAPVGALLLSVDGNPGTASFSWTPTAAQVGDHTLTVTAHDLRTPPASAPSRTLQIHVVAANRPPVVSSAAADALGSEGQTLVTSGAFDDPDGEPLTLSANNTAGAFTAHPDGTWEWSLPTNDDVGPATIVVTATDPHGLTVTDEFVYRAANLPPVVTSLAAGDPLTVDEGASAVTYHYTFSDVGAGDTIVAATTSCGTAGTKVGGSDTRDADGGTFACVFPDGPAMTTLAVTVTDDDGDTSTPAFQSVTVRDLPPSVTLDAGNDLDVDEGPTRHTYSYAIGGLGGDTVVTVQVSCGADGQLIDRSSTFTDAGGSFMCEFRDGPASSTVSVVVTDSDGSSSAPATQAVAVHNVAPTVALSGANDLVADEGAAEHAYTFSVSDPGDDAIAVTSASCGTGGAHAAGSDTPTSFSCTFPDGPATTTVRIVVADSDGASSAPATQDVTVRNVLPTVGTIATTSPRHESTSVDVSGAISDPGWPDVLTATIDWGEPGGSPVALTGTLENGVPTATLTYDVSHAYGDDGVFTVTVCAHDDDDPTTVCNTTQVTITNVDPTATIDETGTADVNGTPVLFAHVGQSIPLKGNATDPGSDDLTLRWSWDDGGSPIDAQSVSLVNPPNPDPDPSPSIQPRDVSFDQSHAFGLACTNDVGFSALDDDGGAGSDTVKVLITGDPVNHDKSAGFWAHEYQTANGDEIDPISLACYLKITAFVSKVFNEVNDVSTFALARKVVAADYSNLTSRIQFDRVALACWLNFANGAFDWNEPVDLNDDGFEETTFRLAMQAAEAVRLSPAATTAEIDAQRNKLQALDS